MLKKTMFFIYLLITLNSLALANQGFSSYIGSPIPTNPSNKKITNLIKQLGSDTIISNDKITDFKKLKIYRELGVLFWYNENYEAANYYLKVRFFD